MDHQGSRGCGGECQDRQVERKGELFVLIVLTGVKSTILLLDKEERGCLGGFGWSDFPRVKIFINKLVGGFSFFD